MHPPKHAILLLAGLLAACSDARPPEPERLIIHLDERPVLLGRVREAIAAVVRETDLKVLLLVASNSRAQVWSIPDPGKVGHTDSRLNNWQNYLTQHALAWLHDAAVEAGTRVMAQFYAQLADLLHAGVPLLRGLDILERQTSHKGLGQVLREVRAKVADGTSLGDAMSQHPRAFTELAVSMVRAPGGSSVHGTPTTSWW